MSLKTTTHTARPTHEHDWRDESSHTTSEGRVSYVRCKKCGARRVSVRALAPSRHA